jgi:hypothetical protein
MTEALVIENHGKDGVIPESPVLIPCPFCGDSECLRVDPVYSGRLNAKGQIAVKCSHCGTIGPNFIWGYANQNQSQDDAMADAILSWNSRSEVTKKANEVARLAAEKIILAFNSAIAIGSSDGNATKIVAENTALKSSLADLLEEREMLINKRDKGRPTKSEQYAGPSAMKRLIAFFRIP